MHCYTDKSKDVYLALIQIFYARSMPTGSFFTSISEILRYMGKANNGKNAAMVSEELERMYKNTISWTFSFHTHEQSAQTVKNQKILSVYNYQKIKERVDLDTIFQQVCEIDFDPMIKANLMQRKTAPLNLTTRLSISSPVKKVLYDQLDMFLANNSRGIYERTGLNLVKDLSLKTSRYTYKSQRKKLLE